MLLERMRSAGELESHLLSLEMRLLEPSTRSDAAALGDLLTDAFVEFGSSGRVFDKQSIILTLNAEAPAEYTIYNFRSLRLSDDAMLVTYSLSRHAGGESSHSLRSSIWRCIDGAWKMAFHQGTRAAQ